MMTSARKEMKTAKAGEELTAKAAARLREDFPFMRGILVDKKAVTVHPKSKVKDGQWMCADCGEVLQNNMGAHFHAGGHPSHRMVWWTGERFEEP